MAGLLCLARVPSQASLVALMETAGPRAFISAVSALIGGVILTLPTTPMEVGIAFFFGFRWGVAGGVVAKTLGSTAAFLCCRWIGHRRSWRAPKRLNERLKHLDRTAHPLVTLLLIRCDLAPTQRAAAIVASTLLTSCACRESG